MEERELSKENVKENVSKRIELVMLREGKKAGEFADSINVAQATLSQILRGRNLPSVEFLLRFQQRYPNISIDWLLTGKGKMEEAAGEPDGGNALPAFGMDENDYPLFAENPENPTERPKVSENRKEIALNAPLNRTKDVVHQQVIYKERPPRKITEIRIFFDDNTYETFRPEKG